MKNGKKILEGEIVTVSERRLSDDGATFLRVCSPQGWAFDQGHDRGLSNVAQVGVCNRMRMMEVHVQRGHWYYSCVMTSGVAVRARCSFSDSARIGAGPGYGAAVAICERVKVGDTVFLRLKDTSSWVFDVKNGRKAFEGPLPFEEFQNRLPATVINADKALRSAPSSHPSAETKLIAIEGSKLEVMMLLKIEGAQWAKVCRTGGGMEGWILAEEDALEIQRPPEPRESLAESIHSAERVRAALHAPLPMHRPKC